MYAGNIQIRGGKCLKPPKPCCDLAIKYVEKELGFPHKNTYNICHFINMCICKDTNATVGYRNG